jgi:hypothetical protein
VARLKAAVLGLLAIDRSNALQEALWQQAAAVSAKDSSMVPTGLFIQTLNDTWTSEITGMIRQCSSSRTSTGSPSNRERRFRGSVSSPACTLSPILISIKDANGFILGGRTFRNLEALSKIIRSRQVRSSSL